MSSVLITGASKGIGRATATAFAQRGHRVIATARDPRSLEGLDVALRLPLDVTDPDSVASAVDAAGDVDVLVSNAGSIFHAAVEATPIAEAEKLFAGNTFGALRIAQALLPQMRARGAGRVLFVSSIAGRVVLPGSAAYSSTKWALEAIAETLALEVARFGISVTLLEPGAVTSGALDDVVRYELPDDPYAEIFAERSSSVGSMISPDEVASAIVDAAETDSPPLRVPVGGPARVVLAARRTESDEYPFVVGADR